MSTIRENGLSTTGTYAGPKETPERITVALVPRATEDLRRAQERTGLSKTDIVNRAISLYEFIDDQLENGNEIFLRNADSGETQKLVIL